MGWIKLAGAWGDLIDRIGLDGTFLAYGIAFGGLVALGSVTMKMPPPGWLPRGFTASDVVGQGGKDFTPREMLRTPQFHLISLTFMVSAGAGLMAIGLMKLHPVEALTDNGMTDDEASAVAGTAMAVFFSIAKSAVGSPLSVVGSRQSAVGSPLSVVGSRQLAVPCQ